jgi:rhodanese-related sulfurtransferase
VIATLMGLRTVSPHELHDLIQEGKVATIDVNTAGSWAEAHVPGARNLDPVAYDPADLPRDKGALLVFYCSNPWCSKAPKAARRARGLGYENVRVLSAGIQGWVSARMPTESSAPAASRADLLR